ncbi:TetR/AcrR family transcriptional regulator [Vibrio sp. SCSIO 43136]|uniref:TetR/AcrR family transcriptional regulator n=1 Tax=Vibrio sp. SCSIO 43136 TaxID=2819101 RepID=UPI0020763C15|nr:TetR/AcrR family transcriptional regulator [Vibrio sp. SCSIO 43136]USD68297.1 TetR/AcrR family transcriptional regulator [Vibrio sp. SCSIO 43136]
MILTTAFEIASEQGLESLTIGELAKQCGMSKSGLFSHFNSKENLQIAVLDQANKVFVEKVIAPIRAQEFDCYELKMRCLLESWLGWNHSYQGSCMFLDAWKDGVESDSPIQQKLQQIIAMWIDYLTIQIEKGQSSGEFNVKLDARQATFELYGLYLSAQLFASINGLQTSKDHFWQGVEAIITRWKTD